MTHRQRIQVRAWILCSLAVMAGPSWAQTVPPIQNGQVEIFGALPRAASGAIDVEALKQTIQAQFARPGVEEVHFRNVSLTEVEQRALFLNSDPNKNLLRQVSAVVPSPNGAERNVTFRNNDFRARVGREEGQLRARLEGIDTTSLTEIERLNLRAQFDRFRLDGANDRGGNQANNRGGRGGNDNSGPGSANSGRGSDNSGPGSANSGSGRGGRDDVGDIVNDDKREDRRLDRREDRREDRQLDRREDRREDRQLDRQADRREDRQLDRRADRQADRQIDRREDRQLDRRVDRQMDRVARIDRPDRPQRPDRPERPQRPERPERPERGGRN